MRKNRFHPRPASPVPDWHNIAAAAFILIVAPGCSGSINGGGDAVRPTGPKASDESSDPGSKGGTGPDITSANGASSAPGIRRLTPAQYVNTVRDLLGVSAAPNGIPTELLVEGHAQIAGAQKTGYDDTNRLVLAADDIASQAAGPLAKTMGCNNPECVRLWAENFVARAFRGPVADEVKERHLAPVAAMASMDGASDVIARLVAGVLASPYFLYRREIGRDTGTPGARSLTGHETASKLSYLLWASMPDETLFEAAADGTLDAAQIRREHVARMLKDPRANDGIGQFVRTWMGVHDNQIGKKAVAVLEGLPKDFAAQAEASFFESIAQWVSDGNTRLSTWLTQDRMKASAAVATVMGAEAQGDDTVAIDAALRPGLLAHPFVIAAHSKEEGVSPFPIGKFVFENILCETIPPPPANLPPSNINEQADTTVRQQLEALTSGPACQACHERIGPPGFAFLPFDAVGRHNPKDKQGRLIDASGTLLTAEGDPTPFLDMPDLVRKLAASAAVSACATRRLYRWAEGRFEAEDDTTRIENLTKRALNSETDLAVLLDEMVTSEDFVKIVTEQQGGQP